MRSGIFTILVGMSLAGCSSGGSGSGDTNAFGEVTKGDQTVTIAVVDEQTRTIAQQIGGSIITEVLQLDSGYRDSAFRKFGAPGDDNALLFEARGDHGVVRVSAKTNTGVPPTYLSNTATSFGGVMPTTGTASYTGRYTGVLTEKLNQTTESYMQGNVSITADFDGDLVSGSISPRSRLLTENDTRAPTDFEGVTLEAHSFANGTSVTDGSTTGGRLDQANAQPEGGGELEGNWNVAFGGDQATEVFGTVTITHDYDQSGDGISADFVERGVFIAN